MNDEDDVPIPSERSVLDLPYKIVRLVLIFAAAPFFWLGRIVGELLVKPGLRTAGPVAFLGGLTLALGALFVWLFSRLSSLEAAVAIHPARWLVACVIVAGVGLASAFA